RGLESAGVRAAPRARAAVSLSSAPSTRPAGPPSAHSRARFRRPPRAEAWIRGGDGGSGVAAHGPHYLARSTRPLITHSSIGVRLTSQLTRAQSRQTTACCGGTAYRIRTGD